MQASKTPPNVFRPTIEVLEDRQMLSTTALSNLGGVTAAFSLHDDHTLWETSGPNVGLIDVLQRWVENDEVPEQIAAISAPGVTPARTRPWCPYPTKLHYVGGDVNTHSLGRAELDDRARLRTALAADPSRLSDPVAHEPLFALAERRGFAWRAANLSGRATYKRDGRGALALDWFFARGLEVADPTVIATGALSDHEAIGLTVRLA
jgi:hypothetical protein